MRRRPAKLPLPYPISHVINRRALPFLGLASYLLLPPSPTSCPNDFARPYTILSAGRQLFMLQYAQNYDIRKGS